MPFGGGAKRGGREAEKGVGEGVCWAEGMIGGGGGWQLALCVFVRGDWVGFFCVCIRARARARERESVCERVCV